MKNYYLLIGVLLLPHLQGMSQQAEVYASVPKTFSGQYQEKELNPLKKALTELENSFKISIAYKDEWIEDSHVNNPNRTFSSVEQALNSILKDTGLYYEKAGDSFYVIHKRKSPEGNQTQASLVVLPSLYVNKMQDFPSSYEKEAVREMVRQVVPEIIVSGTIIDENGAGFPGVNILVKGTTTGTTTDTNGKYSLSVENENAVLVFSFVGYAIQEIGVGGRTVVDVTMQPDIKSLEEVVVTALGIKKETKRLGYATSSATPDQITENRTANFMNGLQGKMAGVNITPMGTGPSGSSKIRIRGQSSFGAQNSPLIVINGIPIDNTSFGVGGSFGGRGATGATDGGDGLTSINPDDIESMTVLKGGAAAALYGSRAKDGVIMITTKSGARNKGFGVEFNSNYTSDTPLDFTDFQYEYGQGEFGVRPTAANPTSGVWSFGEKFQPGMTQVLFDGVTVPYEPVRDRITKFYRTGSTFTNTISMSSGGENGSFNLSLANMTNKSIQPNTKFDRQTINLGFNQNITKK